MKKLSNLELEEVSLVDKGAVPRTFLIVKSDTNIRIESDGTTGKLFVNDQELTDISGFSFNLWDDNKIYCSYDKKTKDENGFEHSENFTLAGEEKAEVEETSKEST